MWKVKTTLIPVIIGATGTISKSFRKYVSNIPRNHEVKELQKTALLGPAHIQHNRHAKTFSVTAETNKPTELRTVT